MNREEAVQKLREIIGVDLVTLAEKFEVTVHKDDKINKGWAGHVLERYLGLPINSAQSPNFGSWELKCVPMKLLKNGNLVFKETMAITMIDPFNVRECPFERSHLLSKLQKMVVCTRMFRAKTEPLSELLGVQTFDLGESGLFDVIRQDYEFVRSAILNEGFDALTGRMGSFVQPRTKGAGHGSKSRAFYAKKSLLQALLPNSELRKDQPKRSI